MQIEFSAVAWFLLLFQRALHKSRCHASPDAGFFGFFSARPGPPSHPRKSNAVQSQARHVQRTICACKFWAKPGWPTGRWCQSKYTFTAAWGFFFLKDHSNLQKYPENLEFNLVVFMFMSVQQLTCPALICGPMHMCSSDFWANPLLICLCASMALQIEVARAGILPENETWMAAIVVWGAVPITAQAGLADRNTVPRFTTNHKGKLTSTSNEYEGREVW